jgi:DNA primase
MRARLGSDLIDDPRFAPGYAPAGFTTLVNHLRRLGASDDELLAAGLAKQASNGRLIDVFRDRLMLPIHGPDAVGEVHGFIGRRNPTIRDEDPYAGPKYLNTAQTDLFNKGAQLFGLHEGRDALAHDAIPVLVEGPLDAIAVTLATGGTHVGVAPLGTAFTDQQADQLLPHIGPGRPGVTVATDADPAGQQAAERAYWQLTARGDDPAHILMNDGYDPAQLLEQHGPSALRAALSDPQPLASTLIAARLAERTPAASTPTAEAVLAATRAVAEIIGALPPEHWLEHITAVTRELDAAPGAVHLAVIDAGHAWTTNPRPLAQTHIAQAARRPTREPAERWRRLAGSIHPRLATSPGWNGLAATLEHAARQGYDVDANLPRLAAASPLPEHAPALELQYRVLAEIDLDVPEPAAHERSLTRAGHPQPLSPATVDRIRPPSPAR